MKTYRLTSECNRPLATLQRLIRKPLMRTEANGSHRNLETITEMPRIYRNRMNVPITWGLLVVGAFLGFGAPILDGSPLRDYLIWWGATPLVLVILYRIGIRPRLESTDAGVSVINGFSSTFIRWDEIGRFEAALRLVIVKRDGTIVEVPSVSGSAIKEIRGEEGYVDRISGELNEKLLERRGLHPQFLELTEEDRHWRRIARKRWAIGFIVFVSAIGVVRLIVEIFR